MTDPAKATRTVVVERVFPHAPAKLWRALTEPSLIAQWLLKNDFSPSVGQSFQLRADPMPNWDGIIDCEVIIVESMKRLAYTWNSLGLESVVVFTLTPEASGTRLRMEQSGFRPDQDAAYNGATYGWQSFIGRLEKVLEGGAA